MTIFHSLVSALGSRTMSSKTCFKCGLTLSRDCFYKHPRMADGLLGKCKACTRSDVQKNRADNVDRYRSYDNDRALLPHRVVQREEYARSPEGRATHARALAESNRRYPERVNARAIFRRAVKRGEVTPWSCCAVPECDRKPQAHHPDYSRPLDVVWLCSTHHRAAHVASAD